jgi:hypothetical protein
MCKGAKDSSFSCILTGVSTSLNIELRVSRRREPITRLQVIININASRQYVGNVTGCMHSHKLLVGVGRRCVHACGMTIEECTSVPSTRSSNHDITV